MAIIMRLVYIIHHNYLDPLMWGNLLVYCRISNCYFSPVLLRGNRQASVMAFVKKLFKSKPGNSCYQTHHKTYVWWLLYVTDPDAACVVFFLQYPMAQWSTALVRRIWLIKLQLSLSRMMDRSWPLLHSVDFGSPRRSMGVPRGS